MKKFTLVIVSLCLAIGLAMPVQAQVKLPPIANKTLGSGLEVIVIENHELPVVIMRMVVRSGSYFDLPDKAGLADLTAGLLRKGTKSRSATEVAEAIDFVGGSLDGSANRDASTISCSILLKHFDVGLDLLSDVILNPVFADDEVERAKNLTLSGIRQSKDSPGTVCAHGFNKMLFGDFPYANPSEGTEASVQSIAATDVKGFYNTYYKPNNAFLLIAGDVQPGTVFKAVDKAFGKWAKGNLPMVKPMVAKAPQGHKILLIDKPDATQTNIRFGNLGITRANPDYYPLLLMNYILGSSFTSRLTQAVRVDKGLTYDIRTVNEFNILPGAYYCNTSTQNENTLTAIQAAIAEINRMKSEKVTDVEFQEAANFYAGYYPMSLETPGDVAGEIIKVKLYGLPVSYIEDFTKNIRKVTKDDILRVAQNHLDTDDMVFCVVSNAADVEQSLQQLGPVEKTSIDQM